MNIILKSFYILLNIISYILLARVLLSWFASVPALYNIRLILAKLTDPILDPIRKLIDKSIFSSGQSSMMLDISPLIAFLIISGLQRYVLFLMNTKY